ncbi:voltage-gated potassium channel [Ceratobasidium sp. AG-I]|nr:voltage-gated potassium channel [Ceratobasidium sp. AG-I]
MKDYILPRLHLFASIAPLTAAVIAPLAVLLDIPALTEKWYTRDGEPRPDPRASLILSGLSLGFSVIANALLVVRFSLRGANWRIATRISIVCWIVKVVTAIVNLVVFGALTRNQPGFSYGEGFWSAVISLLAAGIILALLLLHWVVEFKAKPSENAGPETPAHTKLQIRVAGRHFMLQNTMLISLIAFTALIYSKIEGWTYLQGIYFTTVTVLTIGFGDFYPTKPSTKVLLFPLGLLGITLLASSISMIVSFFNKHQREHKARARAEREKAWHMSQMSSSEPSLEREVEFLSQLHERQGWRDQAVDLIRSITGFLAFWFVGAAIFGAVESWSYGDALYFCYVFFLSIGYGDFAPISPAGRVIFIVYALMAVPVMASFAIQAVQNVIERMSIKRMDRRRAEAGDKTSPESMPRSSDDGSRAPMDPASQAEAQKEGEGNTMDEDNDEMHSTLVAKRHSELSRHSRPSNSHLGSDSTPNLDLERKTDIQSENLKALLEHAVSLERTARRLLVAHLEEGSRAQILLRADWNLQARDLRALEKDKKGQDGIPSGFDKGEKVNENRAANGNGVEKEKGMNVTEAGVKHAPDDREEREETEIAEVAVGGMDDEETLKAVREFREHVAGMLALGSCMRELEGVEKYVFERRRQEKEEIESRALRGKKQKH